MTKIISRIAIAFAIVSLMGITAMAKVKRESVRFDSDIKVNGTVVKKGTYQIRFDDATGELSIEKSGKVIASANTTTEKRDNKAKRLEIRSSGIGDDSQLTKVAFAGMDHNLVVGGSAASN